MGYRDFGCFCAMLLLTLSTPWNATAQMVDLNANGMSDIWELIYESGTLDPAADTDGDGVSNLLESLAGTDPFDPDSVPRITAAVTDGTNLNIQIAGQLGKVYELQSVQSVDSQGWTNWVSEAGLVLRSGTNVTFSRTLAATSGFLRIAISDVDTDGDGVNDWEEYKLGLDPRNPTSNGQIDLNGHPLNDGAYVAGKLALQNVISLTAADATADQPDPGHSAINVGLLTITRGGFPLNNLTINLGPSGGSGPGVAIEGVDYLALPRSLVLPAGVASQSIAITPLSNPNLAAPAVATVTLIAGRSYALGSPQAASAVIFPSATPAGTGLSANYFTNSSATYSSAANFNPANLIVTRVDSVVDFNWSNNASLPIPNSGYYSIRWSGQIQPEYSELYYFDANSDDGVKLWVNDQLVIDSWVLRSAADSVGTINLQGGARYNIRMEYFNGGASGAAHLYWYSPSQPKQIVPSRRLYPATAQPSPAVLTSALSTVAFLGQPFSFTLSAANSPTTFSASGLPPGLALNFSTGLISGTPTVAGDFQVTVTAANSSGLGASVLKITVLDTGSSVVREVWLGVPGTNVADIPITTPPSAVSTLGGLEGLTDFGDNYGERIRGFITAPITGNYFFWIAGSDSAELWISNDAEPANKVRRAFVSPGSSSGSRQWTAQASQQSRWLSLVAGQQYYIEILHKAGVGAGDNWSVAWNQDPTGTNFTPGGLVPGYVLSRYFPLPPSTVGGVLYTANLLAQGTVNSSGVGSGSLQLSSDGSQAVLSFKYAGLTSPVTGKHIHCDPYLNNPSQIMFDIDTAAPQPDGSYVWSIGPVGTLTAADVLEIIREGKAYLNVHTANYPAGEISGHFTAANGTPDFTPPPPAPAWSDDHTNSNAAARFLIQATFGPSPTEIGSVQALGYEGWIDNQFSVPPTHHLPYVLQNRNANPVTPYPSSLTFNSWWQQSLRAPDQLRQRIAFALSEIMVVSAQGVLANNPRALSDYYDTLLDNAFGNFRELLEAITLSPAMGLYLDMRGNDKGNIITGSHANENYAREILQLFSIGVNRLWPDGTTVMDSKGNVVPSYNQSVIMGFASAFTGWNYYQSNQANGRLPTNFGPPANYTNPMVLVPTHHDLGAKSLLDNVVSPQAWGSQANSSSTNFDAYCANDLEQALDSIFYHQNVGPFICRQLIQRLVTSSPSREYVYRVVQAFDDNGSGIRGDLQAVVKAILLDYEARSGALSSQATYGKQREPLLRATATARAFPAPAPAGGTYAQNGSRTITITTTNAHRLNSGDVIAVEFTDASGQPTPNNQGYSATVISPTFFTVNDPALAAGTYTQSPNLTISNMVTANLVVTNVIYVTISSHGLAPGNPVYLNFTSGGAVSGLYQTIWRTNNMFAVATGDTNALSGNILISKISNGGYVQRGTNITISLPVAHGLLAGNPVYINFTSGTAADGTYSIVSTPDPVTFTVTAATSANQTISGVTIYSLVAPPLVRSGTVLIKPSTWNVGSTDGSLTQTPLNSPTVFNFFYPDYMFPGALAAAGLTTPEFQLTSDTDVALQMNFLEGGLLNNGGNTNGLSSFVGGNGAIVLDLGPWITPAYAANSGIPGLVDALSTLLTGGALSPAAKNTIVGYVANSANFPYSSPPTATQMRDRVRAVVHLIVTSPDFTVLK